MKSIINKIQITRVYTKEVIFEYTTKYNTIKETVIKAVDSGVDLSYANLRYADLRGASLSGAILRGADLRYANLQNANLYQANLCEADLYKADLCSANLCSANLCDTYIHYTNLHGAYLIDAKNIPYIPFACPTDGAFIGWKKIDGRLVKLEIPEDARRSSATTRKCRCDKAKVLEITDIDGNNPISEIENISKPHHLLYKVGEMVYPDSFDEDRWNECSHGIHFFINKQEAINYQIY